MPVFYVTDNYGEGRSGPALLDLVEPPELLTPQSAPGRLMRSGWAGAGWWGRGRYNLRVRRGQVSRQLVPVMGSRKRMYHLPFEEACTSEVGTFDAVLWGWGGRGVALLPGAYGSSLKSPGGDLSLDPLLNFGTLLPVELVLSPLSSSLLSSLSPIASV